MDLEVDHYAILGLPSGEEGAKLMEKDISKAYKVKALELHPDKNRDDPHAHEKFQRLKTSYEILKDEKARKLFDDLLKVRREQQRRHSEQDSRKRKMVSDLEERERASFAPDSNARKRAEEEKIAQKFKEEVARIRAMHANQASANASATETESGRAGQESVGTVVTEAEKQKILKVSWERIGGDYPAERLEELFSKFGKVEDVVMTKTKNRKKGSALVVMATREAVDAATRSMCGDLSNPLLVLPLLKATRAEVPTVRESPEPQIPDHLPGIGYQAFEDVVIKKLREAAEKKKKFGGKI